MTYQNLKKNIHANRHILGIISLGISLTPFLLPFEIRDGITLTIFYFYYCLGVILISDSVAYHITGTSLLDTLFKNSRARSGYILIGVLAGFILEIFCMYLGGLWYYPYYSLPFYLTIMTLMGGFAGYWLCLLLAYEAVKVILDKYFGGARRITRSFKYERTLYPLFGLIGTIGLGIVLSHILSVTDLFRDFALIINHDKEPYIGFGYVLLTFISFTFLLEYVEFKRHRTSLLKDIIHGYYIPIISIVIVSLLLSLYMEFQNLPLELWIYTNWPGGEYTFGGLPILVFLTWPLHYIFFLSFYRAFGDRSSAVVWNKS